MRKKLPIISLIVSIIGMVITLLWGSEKFLVPVLSVVLVLEIGAIVIAIIAKKDLKKENKKDGKTTAAIIIACISIFLVANALLGLAMLHDTKTADEIFCPQPELVKDCVDNGDGTSKCTYNKTITITCTTEKLKDEQMKK